MNRLEEADAILKWLAQLYKQNPELQIELDTIYYVLMNYGYEQSDKIKEVERNFDNWQTRFMNNPNISVYRDSRQPSFLQFRNDTVIDKATDVKLYLSIDSDHIYECVNTIFDFISQNNMPTYSKVANRERSDDVVIRLPRMEDAKKVIDFINSNPQITRYARRTNPFLMRQGVVAVAYDKYLSFNKETSQLIKEYLEIKRQRNELDDVNIQKFANFVAYTYEETFNNLNRIDHIIDISGFEEREERFGTKGDLMLNYEQVYSLLLKQLSPNFDLQGFEQFYAKCNDLGTTLSMVKYYNDSIRNKQIMEYNEQRSNAMELINSYVNYCLQNKKMSLEQISLQLNGFANGKVETITRDNNYRSLFMSQVLPKDIFVATKYIEELIEKQKVEAQANSNVTVDQKCEYFLEACIATLRKYDKTQLTVAINQIIHSNNFGFITNDSEHGHKYRVDLKAHYTKEEIITYRDQLIDKLAKELSWTIPLDNDMTRYFADILNAKYSNNRSL